MLKRHLLPLLLLLGCLRAETPAPQPVANDKQLPETCYLFSYFKGNGEDGLHLAWSTNGFNWSDVPGAPSLRPQLEDKILRDPSIAQGPDGVFHMVWTTSWTKGGFGHASSRDLRTWSEQQYVPAMAHEAAVQNTWAPELFFDTSKQQWLILWSSTITGRFSDTDPKVPEGKHIYNHRLYSTTTTDFTSFSPTRLFYDDGFSVIDALVVPVEDRFALVMKDERLSPQPRKNLRIAWGRSADGSFGPAAASFTASLKPGWLEGPTVIRIGDRWFLYADAYRDKHYILLTSPDLSNWTDETPRLSYPAGMRHGTAFPVSRAILRGLLVPGS